MSKVSNFIEPLEKFKGLVVIAGNDEKGYRTAIKEGWLHQSKTLEEERKWADEHTTEILCSIIIGNKNE